MKIGELVFFHKAQNSSGRKAQAVILNGIGFGILLGEVPPLHQGKDPPPEYIFRALGSIGFASFDDLAELAGLDEKTMQEVLAKWNAKYYPKDLKTIEEAKPKLVSPSGQEIQS